ncbi:MAG: hypothetical protein MZW92_34920 [Comamonadaceae bacterium]|nr:hypothetical protein [Comamonadaceae bacterium]
MADAGQHGDRDCRACGCARHDRPIADPVRWEGAELHRALLGARPRAWCC